MLLPSILHILDQSQVQSKIVRNVESGFKEAMTAAVEGISGLERIESANANAADTAKPLTLDPASSEKAPAAQSHGEWLRIINKFQNPNRKRVVDFFE